MATASNNGRVARGFRHANLAAHLLANICIKMPGPAVVATVAGLVSVAVTMPVPPLVAAASVAVGVPEARAPLLASVARLQGPALPLAGRPRTRLLLAAEKAEEAGKDEEARKFEEAGKAEKPEKAKKIDPGKVEVETPVYRPDAEQGRVDEVWHYGFSWSGIPVGKISIENRTLAADEEHGRRLAIRAWGRTNSFVDLLWRYRLNARGTIRLDPFGPAEFYAEEEERKKKKVTRIEFSKDGVLSSERRKGDRVAKYSFEAPNTYDIVSTVFLTLSFDYEIGQEYLFDVFTGTSRYLVPIKVEAREEVKAAGEMVDSYRLLVSTRPLTDPEDKGKHRQTELWVSAERPRRLLKSRSKTFIGAVYVSLESIEPLGQAESTASNPDSESAEPEATAEPAVSAESGTASDRDEPADPAEPAATARPDASAGHAVSAGSDAHAKPAGPAASAKPAEGRDD